MKSSPPVRVRNQEMSLWQSVISEFAVSQLKSSSKGENTIAAHAQDHPMIRATNAYVLSSDIENSVLKFELSVQPKSLNSTDDLNQYLSELCFHIAKAKSRNNEALEEELMGQYRKYSDKDPGFLTCATTYAKYYAKYGGVLKYNKWQDNGGFNYGVIEYEIPNDAKVAIIGDWGTGMPDAQWLLYNIMENIHPDVIIHLGDIYYSATPSECINNFAAILDEVFKSYDRIPVFTIPGNHDYYAFAYGYYDMVLGLNENTPTAVQPASYFQLKTQDNGWQFLGMDTGFDDSNPANQFNTFYAGPQLKNNETQWHRDKLDTFGGNTVLLSHHQLFTGNAKINGFESVYGSYPYLNKYLLDDFRYYFGDKVAAWFWGHEHNQVIYKNNLFGLPKGRLVGASAYEEMTSNDPYKQKYQEVPFEDIKLSHDNGYYNHGFAVLDFSGRNNPTDSVVTTYYEYPSWGDVNPDPIPGGVSELFQEKLSTSPKDYGPTVNYGEMIHLNLEGSAGFIAPFKNGSQYYPIIGTTTVFLEIQGGSGVIMDEDVVTIKSLENGLGKYNILGAWSTSKSLYYYTPGYKQQNWIVKKVFPSDDKEIHQNDPLYFINQYHTGQYLCPYISTGYSDTYLTTNSNVPAVWFLKR
ncbi:metallophosphoesterase family protein [Winogradskyella luteola]|uniref:Metallophosphoesterase n=1 Tax=Winogradskyella luteola TaxID=2828330 RepID=A0A9X1FCW9_9FLAO|nr:metallophosphoesterase [Winogradskyella luteola]MBV7270693.1 metallophosphoesterase [Winogradskyella luteola]